MALSSHCCGCENLGSEGFQLHLAVEALLLGVKLQIAANFSRYIYLISVLKQWSGTNTLAIP